MSEKTDTLQVPATLADMALIDAPSAAAAASLSTSSFLARVRRGEAPEPVLRGNRCTRWRAADVRAWLIELASQPHDDFVIERARKANKAAAARRQAAKAGA